MAPQITSRMTYEDYDKLPNDGKRYEIIDGELYVNPAPVPRHQIIVSNIHFQLRSRLQDCRVLDAPIDVVFAEDSIVQPDVIAIRSERASIIGEKNIQGAPNLVVEVLSDGTRRLDEIDKRKLYERSGVDEYWIVDPVLELVKVYRREGTAFTRVAEISTETGGAITSPQFPGFSLDVHDVFAE
jgi:Uma2 family endonuclease